MAFGADYDLDSGLRENDGVGVDAKARNSKFLNVPFQSLRNMPDPERKQMSKPEPLFPPSADCPECGKKIRIKWVQPRDVAPGLTGLGQMKCLHCGANHLRAVGPGAAVEETASRYAAAFHAACEHDHGHDHEHDHMHGVSVVPGSDNFGYIKLPG